MAVDPNPSLWNSTDLAEITAIDFGTGDAGSYLVAEAGVEYHIWNDKGNVLTSSPMTSVLVSVRDNTGLEVLNLTTQCWLEVKSLTIHAGGDGGAVGDYVDDNMADFQPVGKDNFLPIGDIPYDCYRKVMFRLKIPVSGLAAGVSFKIYITNQQAQSSIAKWITGVHGNGVIYLVAGAFDVSINGGNAGLLDIEKGFALITNSQVYYGNAQQYDISGLANGTYKIYLTMAGAISSILEASAIPANTIELTRAIINTAECTSVTDKRNFIASVITGLDAAKTATPTINQVYIATDTTKIYACFVDDSWTLIYSADNVIKTGTFTAGRMVKINNVSGIIEMATNTDAEVSDAVTKAHAQNSDAHLGTVDQDIPMNTHKFTGLSVPAGNGDSIRATTKITEVNLEDVHDKKHTQGTDQKLDDGGANEVAVTNLKPLITNKVLTSGAAISWDMADGKRATLIAEHTFTLTLTKLAAILEAILIVTQDGTGTRVMDDIITQQDAAIIEADVVFATDTITVTIDIPTGARIRFKTTNIAPDPLVVDTIYYAIRVDATHIQVAASKANAHAGTEIVLTDDGTGTHTVQQLVKWPGGTLGVLQTGVGAEDIIKLHYKASDEQWYAEIIANFS